jgi:hypothetical protein
MSSALVGFFEESLVGADSGGDFSFVFFVVGFAAGLVGDSVSSLLLVAATSLLLVGEAAFAGGAVDVLGEEAALVLGDFDLVKRFLLEGCLKKDMMDGCAFFFLDFSAVTDGVILRPSNFFVIAFVGGVATSSATTSKAVGIIQQCGVNETGSALKSD